MQDLVSAKLLFTEAEKLGLKPKWLTDYGLFSIIYKGKTHYVFYGTSYLNSELSSYLAKNKHITRIILAEHNLPNIPFCLPQSFQEALDFFSLHKKIIAKPTLGKHSQNILLIENEKDLHNIDLKTSFLEKFIEGEEYRVLMLKGEPIAFHRKIYTPPINDPEKVKRISFMKKDWDEEMLRLAIQSMQALSLEFGCVDFMKDRDGNIFILEINSAPGIKRFQEPDEGVAVNISSLLLTTTLTLADRE